MKAYLTTIYKNGQECERYLDMSKENSEAFIAIARMLSKEYTGKIKVVEVKEDGGH